MEFKGPAAPLVDEFSHRLKEGYSLLKNNRLVEAKETLEKALEIRPGNDRALNLLAMVFFKLEQYPKAVKIFKQLIKTNPSFPTLYMNIGLAFIKMGDFAAALPEIQHALELDPQHPNAHNYLGLAYSKIGHFEAARDEFIMADSHGMAAKMEEKIRESQGGTGGYDQVSADPAYQEPMPEEITFEKPQEAYSTFDSIEGSGTTQDYSLPKDYPQNQDYPQTENNPPSPDYAQSPEAVPELYGTPAKAEPSPDLAEVPLQPPEGVEDHSPLPEVAPAVKEEPILKPEIWSLKELSKAYAVSKNNIPALHLRNDKLLQVVLKGGQVYSRLGGMVVSEGELSFDSAFKRFRGKETKAVFGGKDNPIMKISGEGQLLLSSQDHRLSLFNLEDEMIYLAERIVFAFQDGILWENGRIQTEGAEDLNLVQFKGRGTVSISTREKIVSISLTSRSPLVADFHSLLGWYGKIVPQVKVVDSLPSGGKGKRTVVELKGDGDVLIEETFQA